MVQQTEAAGMVKYQFQIDDEKWNKWKKTVPRDKSLEDRIIELIEADTEGRVVEDHGGAHREPTANSQVAGAEGSPEIDRDRLRDELAGSGDVLEHRVDETLAMYERLQELGTAEKDDLLKAVDIDATGYASENSVWSNMVKGRDTLKSLPGVEPPPTGRTEWKYNPTEEF